MKTKSITELARDEIKDLTPCIHGGDVARALKEKMLRHGILIRDCSSFRGLDEYYI